MDRQLYEFAAGNICPATLADEKLQALLDTKPQYAEQFEFWQLRAWCLLRREWFEPETPILFDFDENMNLILLPTPEDLTPDPRPRAIEYLERAAALETGTADSLCLAYKLRRELWIEELDAGDDAAHGTGSEQGESIIELMARLEKQELAYLQRCIDAAPQMSWPYLQRARYWSEYGELELCEADLKAAASAKDQHCPQYFPVSLLLRKFEQGELMIDASYSGLFVEAYQHGITESPLAMLGPVNANFMLAFNMDGNVARFTSLHQAACALGQAPQGGLFCPSAALVAISRPAYSLLLYAPEMYDSRQRTLAFNLQRNADEYFRRLRGQDGPYVADLHYDSEYRHRWRAPGSWDYFAGLAQRRLEFQAKVEQRVKPFLKRFESLDYSDLMANDELAAGIEWPPRGNWPGEATLPHLVAGSTIPSPWPLKANPCCC
ncbi:hypothetical protein IT575_05790 [bacterium]|nr:hypothetical protein [bacterium]